jgi:hypothetical protein
MALKLIGAGLGRTGTLSLKVALEQLGYGPCYHMAEVLMHIDTAPGLWIRAHEGRPDWDRIFNGFAATVDYPGGMFWKELAAYYPEAKVLLSVRDPQSWFESTQASIFGPMMDLLRQTPAGVFLDRVIFDQFGDRIHDRDFMIDHFKRHNDEVVAGVPADRLLVYEAKQGWDPLCAFLGVPVPDAPFPRINSREEMAATMATHGPITSGDELVSMVKQHLGRA